MRDAIVALHAVAGVVAFGAGVWLLMTTSRAPNALPYRTYVCSMVVMALALGAAVGLDWPDLSAGTRGIFLALCALAAAMVYVARTARSASGTSLVERVGFNLIALFDGFAIILALTAGAPGWALAVVGVAGVLIGRRGVRRRAAAASPERPVTPAYWPPSSSRG